MATTDLVLETTQPQQSWRQRVAEKRLPWIPIAVLLVLIICAAFAHWLAPHDPTSLKRGQQQTGAFRVQCTSAGH